MILTGALPAYLSPDVQIFADPAASASVDGGIPGYSVDNFPLRTQREESSSAPSDAANVLPAEKANILAHKNRSPPASLQDVEVVEQQQPVEDSTEDPEHIMTDESEHEVDVENQPAARSLVEDPGRVSSDHLEGVERVQEPALDTGDEVNPSSDDSESQIVGSVHESGGSISPAHSSLHHADSEEGAPSKSPTSIRTFKSLPPAQVSHAPHIHTNHTATHGPPGLRRAAEQHARRAGPHTVIAADLQALHRPLQEIRRHAAADGFVQWCVCVVPMCVAPLTVVRRCTGDWPRESRRRALSRCADADSAVQDLTSIR